MPSATYLIVQIPAKRCFSQNYTTADIVPCLVVLILNFVVCNKDDASYALSSPGLGGIALLT